MCDGVVLRTPNGEEFCIWIPVQIPKLKWPPDPDPWKDLHILVNIHELVSQLGSERMQTQLTEVLRDSAQQVAGELPEGLELGDNFMTMSSKAAAD